MSKLKPSVLFIGVLACLPLLALHLISIPLSGRHGGVMVTGLEMFAVGWRQFCPSLGLLANESHVVPALSLVLPVLFAFATAWVCVDLPRLWHRLAFMIGLGCLVTSLSFVLAAKGVLFEPLSSLLTILIAGVGGIVFGQTERGRRIHDFREFFVDRLSTEGFEKLVALGEPVKLAGKYPLTSLTCRLLDTNELAASIEPQALEQMSSAFLKASSEFLIERGAYLDVCNSQGVTVQLGFPLKDKDHVLHACKLALELRGYHDTLAAEFEKQWKARPSTGIALATGECACGLVGYHSFQFYSALGEAPEMSRRLCNMNGVYGSRILIAASTFTAAKEHIEVRPMELLSAPGQTGLQEVYELLGEKGCLSSGETSARDAFWQGVVALRQGDADNALAKLRQAIVVGKEDAPLKYFKQRAETSRQRSKSHVRQSEHAG